MSYNIQQIYLIIYMIEIATSLMVARIVDIFLIGCVLAATSFLHLTSVSTLHNTVLLSRLSMRVGENLPDSYYARVHVRVHNPHGR